MNKMIPILGLFFSLLTVQHTASAKELSTFSVRKVMHAHQLQQDEKLQDAITVLQDYQARQDYDKAYIARMLGGLYWQVEQPEKTIEQLNIAVDLQQLDEQPQRETISMLADILLSKGLYSKAEKRYQQLLPLLKDNKKQELTWLRLAQSQYQQQKWQQVEHSVSKQQHYQQAAKIPAQVLPLNMLLGAQMAQKKWRGAITTTRGLRELEPNNEMWWRQLSSLYMHTEQHQQALITLQQAQRVGISLSQQQLTLLAQLYAQAGVPLKSAQIYQQLHDIEESEQLLVQQAMYWQQAKEWQLAMQTWQRAAHYQEKYYRQYALLAIQERQLDKALSAIDKMSRQDASLLLLKAQVLNELGKTDHALHTVTEAHQLEPSDSTESWIKFLAQTQQAKTSSYSF